LVSVHTIANQAAINKYVDKIVNTNNYYYSPETPKENVAVLHEGKELPANTQKLKKGFRRFKKKLRAKLSVGSKVYVMKLKTNDGKTFDDYLIFNPKGKLYYDNSFLGAEAMFFKFIKTTGTKMVSVDANNDTTIIRNDTTTITTGWNW
jgi:hypothetical protein